MLQNDRENLELDKLMNEIRKLVAERKKLVAEEKKDEMGNLFLPGCGSGRNVDRDSGLDRPFAQVMNVRVSLYPTRYPRKRKSP